jgi:hypothetical protein
MTIHTSPKTSQQIDTHAHASLISEITVRNLRKRPDGAVSDTNSTVRQRFSARSHGKASNAIHDAWRKHLAQERPLRLRCMAMEFNSDHKTSGYTITFTKSTAKPHSNTSS